MQEPGDVDFDEYEDHENRCLRTMVCTPDGLEPPMFKRALTNANARTFLSEYHDYVTSVERHQARGDPRLAVTLIAMIPRATQQALRSRYFRGQQVTAEALLGALRGLAGMNRNQGTFDAEKFMSDIRNATKMGNEPTATTRTMLVTQALYTYLDDNQCYDKVMYHGAWRPGPGKVVSDNLIAGIWPALLRNKVQSQVSMTPGAENDPDRVLDVIMERAEYWAEVEDYIRYRKQMRQGMDDRFVDSNAPRNSQVGNGQIRNDVPHNPSSSEQSNSNSSGRSVYHQPATGLSHTCWQCGGAGHTKDMCPSPAGTLGNRGGAGSRSGRTTTASNAYGPRNNNRSAESASTVDRHDRTSAHSQRSNVNSTNRYPPSSQPTVGSEAMQGKNTVGNFSIRVLPQDFEGDESVPNEQLPWNAANSTGRNGVSICGRINAHAATR